MQALPLVGPDQQPPRQEHPAASPERLKPLIESIREEPEQLARLLRRHLTSIRELDAPLVRQLMRLAARYEAGEMKGTHPMRCRILSNLFMDRTHCTGRLSFNAAWLRLGGSLLQFDQNVDQILARRHAPDEIAELCNSYADMALLRTGDTETFEEMLPLFKVPVINAGNGSDEHPSHALADFYMLAKWRPELLQENPPENSRLSVGIVGDPIRTRSLRSFLRLLALFPRAVDRVVLMQRLDPGVADSQLQELAQAGLQIQSVQELYPVATDMEAARELLPTLDLIYVHHLKHVQIHRLKIVEAATLLSPHAMILDPEIHNEEVANRFTNSPHNGYFGQARGSVYVRMALFAAIMG